MKNETPKRMIFEFQVVDAMQFSHLENPVLRYQWVPVEPAPPKDWKPWCFGTYENPDECVGTWSPLRPVINARCEKCPFRKPQTTQEGDKQ